MGGEESHTLEFSIVYSAMNPYCSIIVGCNNQVNASVMPEWDYGLLAFKGSKRIENPFCLISFLSYSSIALLIITLKWTACIRKGRKEKQPQVILKRVN